MAAVGRGAATDSGELPHSLTGVWGRCRSRFHPGGTKNWFGVLSSGLETRKVPPSDGWSRSSIWADGARRPVPKASVPGLSGIPAEPRLDIKPAAEILMEIGPVHCPVGSRLAGSSLSSQSGLLI